MIVFKFKTETEFKKAEELMKKAIVSFGTSHFDHSYQPEEKTITVSENKAPIVEGWFKKNNVNFTLNRGYGKFAVADYLRYLVRIHTAKKNIETVYSNKFLEIQKISDPKNGVNEYFYLHEMLGKGVISILPFKKKDNKVLFLLRKEITPCWSMDYNISSVTGKHDQRTPTLTAVKELKEEAGYEVSSKDMINLGTCKGTKSCDTTFYLFSVDLTDKKEGKATTDGSELEKNASCIWDEDVSKSVDPLSYVSYYRLTKKLNLR